MYLRMAADLERDGILHLNSLPCACGHKLKSVIYKSKGAPIYRVEMFHNGSFVDGWVFRETNEVLTAPVEAINYLAKIRRVFIARGDEVCAEWWRQVSLTLIQATTSRR